MALYSAKECIVWQLCTFFVSKNYNKNRILLITYGVVLFLFIYNYQWLVNIIKFLFNLFSPFIVGGVIALILNVLVKALENNILKRMNKGKRAVSIL